MENLISQGTYSDQIFQTNPEDFSLFLRLLDLNVEDYAAQSSPRVTTEHIPVLLQ